MQTGSALEAARAIGRLSPGGPWIGFGLRGEEWRFAAGTDAAVHDAPAAADLLLALAIAHFAQAFDVAPPDLEATQADLSALVSHLVETQANVRRQALLSEALDAIDDGLAGDAVAGRLAAARSPGSEMIDPADEVLAAARELDSRG